MLKVGTALAAFGFSFALAQAPAQAASPMTQAFLANVASNLAILSASGHLAADHSDSTDLIDYAASEIGETRQVAVALTDATPSDVHFAADVPGDVTTGRSVAVTGMTSPPEPVPPSAAANARLPATAELATLNSLHGATFDRMFFIVQLDSLSQIESDYRTYIKQGDDPAVAKMAREQLPALMKRIEALTKV